MDYKNDGIPRAPIYVTKKGVNISSQTVLIAAPTGQDSTPTHNNIIITDIIFSKTTTGVLTLSEDTSSFMDINCPANGTVSHSFTGPLKLARGKGLRIQLNDTDTDYSLMIIYHLGH